MERFYREVYGGSALTEAELPEAVMRAQEALRAYERRYRVTGDENARKLAVCAMAEAIVYFQKAQNGEGGLRYAKVGTVSVSGKGTFVAEQQGQNHLRRAELEEKLYPLREELRSLGMTAAEWAALWEGGNN